MKVLFRAEPRCCCWLLLFIVVQKENNIRFLLENTVEINASIRIGFKWCCYKYDAFSLSLSPLFPKSPYNASSTIWYSPCTVQLSWSLRDIYSYMYFYHSEQLWNNLPARKRRLLVLKEKQIESEHSFRSFLRSWRFPEMPLCFWAMLALRITEYVKFERSLEAHSPTLCLNWGQLQFWPGCSGPYPAKLKEILWLLWAPVYVWPASRWKSFLSLIRISCAPNFLLPC